VRREDHVSLRLIEKVLLQKIRSLDVEGHSKHIQLVDQEHDSIALSPSVGRLERFDMREQRILGANDVE